MRATLRIGPSRAGRRLGDVVADWLPRALGRTLSRSSTRRLIAAGVVRVDGRAGRPGQPLRAGTRLDADVDLEALPPEPGLPQPVSPVILYEDDALIAVDKPPGLPMHATADPARIHLEGLVRAMLARRARASPESVRLAVHHRLDRDTSGVALFAKDPRADPGLAAAFAGRTAEKRYRALTARPARLPPLRWTVDVPLAARGGRVSAAAAGGDEAHTSFRLLETFTAGLLVEARPRTGRKHQVRVHLAAAGAPILGDGSHAPRAVAARAPRVMLHAARLVLRHPLTGVRLDLKAPDPPDFAALCAALRHPGGSGASSARARGSRR